MHNHEPIYRFRRQTSHKNRGLFSLLSDYISEVSTGTPGKKTQIQTQWHHPSVPVRCVGLCGHIKPHSSVPDIYASLYRHIATHLSVPEEISVYKHVTVQSSLQDRYIYIFRHIEVRSSVPERYVSSVILHACSTLSFLFYLSLIHSANVSHI
jgi:hypothetical protein